MKDNPLSLTLLVREFSLIGLMPGLCPPSNYRISDKAPKPPKSEKAKRDKKNKRKAAAEYKGLTNLDAIVNTQPHSGHTL